VSRYDLIFFVTLVPPKLIESIFFCSEMTQGQKDKIATSKRISNPGCYPTGFIGLIRPLVEMGLLPEGTPVTVNAISGYTGGGKGLIAEFESGNAEPWGAYGFSLVSVQ